jgi:HK97 family phage major capsid protein
MQQRLLVPEDYRRNRPRGDLFFKLATAYLRSQLGKTSLERAARQLFNSDDALLVTRAAVSPATTTTTGWAAELAGQMVWDVLQSITSLSAAASLIGEGQRVSLDGITTLKVPGRQVNPAAPGATWIAEGLPSPVRVQAVFAGPTLTPHKLLSISTFTGEQARSSNIEQFVRAALSESLALALDLKMFSADAATAAAPAGLLNGVTPIAATPASGNNTANVIAVADVAALVKALAASGGGLNPVFIASPAQAVVLKVFTGPLDAPIFPSAGVPDRTLIAVESESIVSGFGSTPTFDMSEGSILHEEDTSPGAVVANAPTRSLFQTDAIGLKATLKGAWAMRVPQHVQFVTATNW